MTAEEIQEHYPKAVHAITSLETVGKRFPDFWMIVAMETHLRGYDFTHRKIIKIAKKTGEERISDNDYFRSEHMEEFNTEDFHRYLRARLGMM